MEIREEQNLIQLLTGSFRLINRATGAIIVYIILIALINGAIVFSPKVGVPQPISSILGSFFSVYSGLVLWRLLAAKAENNGESISNSFSASLLPTVYMIVYSLIVGVAVAAFAAIIGVLRAPLKLMILLAVLLSFIAMTRLLFVPLAIALRNQGPVEAIVYSWNLTAKRYIKVVFGLILSMVFPFLIFGGIGYGLYVGIPLYFADSFNLAALTAPWYCLLAALLLLWVFLWLSMTAFLLLLFLNLDYGENRFSFTPNVVKEAQAKQQSFAPARKPEPVNLKTQNVNLLDEADVQTVSVTQASIKTESAPEHLSEHLDQVYQPKQEDLEQYVAEEDRMPTILFDDDMARQMEENRKMWEQQAQTGPQEDKGEDDSPIKMSK